MSTLTEILDKVKKLPLDEQMKQICDKIQEEEELNFKDLKSHKPVGSNIFLAINVPPLSENEINFLCLERDFPGVYIASLWSKVGSKDTKVYSTNKRIKVWECKENTTQKILEFYSRTLKFIKGD
jgi:hypothetical protein